ncbi:tyrosine-type recombinase/integrase [Candidatus Latescibacterota bacterium]
MKRKPKKTRGIRLRGSIFWIRYSDGCGSIRDESTHSRYKRDAETLLSKRKQEVIEGKLPELKKYKDIRLNDFSVEYLNWAERQRSVDHTKRFTKQLLSDFGNIPLNSFTTKLIEQWQSDRMKIRGNKPATVNRMLAVLKHMFTKANEWDMVKQQAFERVRKVKLLSVNNQRLRYLTEDECQRLIETCYDHLKPIVITAINTGMRKTEILTLRWDCVDLQNRIIKLDVTKNGERREIPINNTLANTFKSLQRRLDTPYVFFDNNGRPFKDVKGSFASALSRAKITDFRFHDLRHTFASHLVMVGVDIKSVQELLGHKTLTMTLRYAHLGADHRAKAVEMLEKRLNENSSGQKLDNLGKTEIKHVS